MRAASRRPKPAKPSALAEHAAPTDAWDDWAEAEALIDADDADATTAEPSVHRRASDNTLKDDASDGEDNYGDRGEGAFWAASFRLGLAKHKEMESERSRKPPKALDHLAEARRCAEKIGTF